MHCKACDAPVEYGDTYCSTCWQVIWDYNKDLTDDDDEDDAGPEYVFDIDPDALSEEDCGRV